MFSWNWMILISTQIWQQIVLSTSVREGLNTYLAVSWKEGSRVVWWLASSFFLWYSQISRTFLRRALANISSPSQSSWHTRSMSTWITSSSTSVLEVEINLVRITKSPTVHDKYHTPNTTTLTGQILLPWELQFKWHDDGCRSYHNSSTTLISRENAFLDSFFFLISFIRLNLLYLYSSFSIKALGEMNVR